MDKLIKPARLLFLVFVLLMLLILYVAALYKLQVVEGAAYYEQSQNNIVTTKSVTAARGNILDRYGRVLVSNRNCNNLNLNTDELFDENVVADPNATLLALVEMIQENGDTYNDDFPVTMTTPFEYVENMTALQETRLKAYLNNAGLGEDASAVELMAWCRERYGIDNSYDAEQTRIIAGIRYELNIRYIIATSPYVFAEDVSIDLITELMESDLKGYSVEVSYVREYNTSYAAHILGYIGLMNDSDVETYTALGYPMNAQVGQDGVEKAFETYLHGIDGEATVTATASGTVTSTVYTEEPQPGNHVYLTIDIGLQEAAEQALSSVITSLNEEREISNAEAELYGNTDDIMQYATGGAVVAVEVDSGEPLAIASYPTFDVSTVTENFSELFADETSPLMNRALSGLYAPGSTFKPCTAIAALDTGKITVDTTITDEVTYRKYESSGYAPTCWVAGKGGSHGTINVAQAIKVSCNYFFYSVGDTMKISTLAEYAKRFGLGEHTGIELSESTGHMSSEEYMLEAQGREWYAGDMLAASIGQCVSVFTPIQLAEYAAALANNGTRHGASLLKAVRSYDYSTQIYSRKAEILSSVETDQSYYDAIHTGMAAVAGDQDGTSYVVFANSGYTVACKTGTAQLGENQTNNAVFICYAPADDPEIAVSVVVEHGGAGSNLAVIARSVLDYYFSFKNSDTVIESEMELLP